MPIITLLTDFGTTDAYVAQMKGQILSICPSATLVDITHSVPAQDVAYGSLLLAQAVPYFPDATVHVAVVDPGVGTSREIVAIEIECFVPGTERKSTQRLVLPDNGLVSLLTERSRILAMHRVTERRFWNSVISSTFHGRDIMGPVAAHWAAGQSIDAFGPKCTELQAMPWPRAQRIDSWTICGIVVALDHFGNVITNVPAESLAAFTQNHRCHVRIDERSMDLPIATTYGEHPPGQAIMLIGSHGFVELAVVGGNAGKILQIERGSQLELSVNR